MLSQFQKQILRDCYSHYLETSSREYTYFVKNSNELVHATNSFSDLEEEGYISDLAEGPFSFTFVIEDSLIRYMKQEEP